MSYLYQMNMYDFEKHQCHQNRYKNNLLLEENYYLIKRNSSNKVTENLTFIPHIGIKKRQGQI